MWFGFWYLFGSLLLVVIVKYYWSRRRIYEIANSMHGPPTVPILGNGLVFHCKEEDLFERIMKIIDSYPSPMRLLLGPKLIVVVKTAQHIEKVFTSSSAANKDDLYRFLKVFNGDSLFTSTGTAWKMQKRLVTPFLGSKYMESYLGVICRCCDTLLETIEGLADGKVVEIDYYLYRFYNDVVNEALTGYNPGAQRGKIDYFISMCHEAYILLHSRMLKVWLHPDFLFRRSKNGKRQKLISETCRNVLREHISLANSNNNDSEEFQSIYRRMLEQQQKHPQSYGNQNLMDHLATLYSAAEDTTTTVSSYLLVLLGMYPAIQDRVLSEIREVFGESVERITFKDLSRMQYLGMCIKETMRIFPIAPMILRKLGEDLEIGNANVPKGTTILLSLYNVQRSPEHWERPMEFYPEHFRPEMCANRHPYAYLPFSAGIHTCPGQLFAVTTIKAALISILPRYVVEADGTWQDIKIKADISIRPVNGHKLRIRRRCSNSS